MGSSNRKYSGDGCIANKTSEGRPTLAELRCEGLRPVG